jgi:hypothetical protein
MLRTEHLCSKHPSKKLDQQLRANFTLSRSGAA